MKTALDMLLESGKEYEESHLYIASKIDSVLGDSNYEVDVVELLSDDDCNSSAIGYEPGENPRFSVYGVLFTKENFLDKLNEITDARVNHFFGFVKSGIEFRYKNIIIDVQEAKGGNVVKSATGEVIFSTLNEFRDALEYLNSKSEDIIEGDSKLSDLIEVFIDKFMDGPLYMFGDDSNGNIVVENDKAILVFEDSDNELFILTDKETGFSYPLFPAQFTISREKPKLKFAFMDTFRKLLVESVIMQIEKEDTIKYLKEYQEFMRDFKENVIVVERPITAEKLIKIPATHSEILIYNEEVHFRRKNDSENKQIILYQFMGMNEKIDAYAELKSAFELMENKKTEKGLFLNIEDFYGPEKEIFNYDKFKGFNSNIRIFDEE